MRRILLDEDKVGGDCEKVDDRWLGWCVGIYIII